MSKIFRQLHKTYHLKDLDKFDAFFRELHKRIDDYETRVGPLGVNRTTSIPSMVSTILFESVTIQFRKEDVLDDLDGMRREIVALRELHKTPA